MVSINRPFLQSYELFYYFLGHFPLFTFFPVIIPAVLRYLVVGTPLSVGFVSVKGFDIAVSFQPGKGGIQGRFFNNVLVSRALSYVFGYFISIGGTVQKMKKNEGIIVAADDITAYQFISSFLFRRIRKDYSV